jgi:hypothetical protein
MSKRGGAELFILLAVLLIAIVGLYYVMKGPGKAVGYNFACDVECSPAKPVKGEMFVTTSSEEAQSMCRAYASEQCRPGVPARAVARSITGYVTQGDPLYYYNYPGSESPIVACQRSCLAYQGGSADCLAKCEYYSSIGDPYAWRPDEWKITGQFAVPGAQSYGGEIRGVADATSRAFPGRAIEIPPRCFECSCGWTYTTPSEEAAANACTNRCGGVVKEVKC